MRIIAGGVGHLVRTPSGGDRRASMVPPEYVSVFVCRCIDCGRLDLGGPSWNARAECPADLPRCRCGAAQRLEQLEVNDALRKVP